MRKELNKKISIKILKTHVVQAMPYEYLLIATRYKVKKEEKKEKKKF